MSEAQGRYVYCILPFTAKTDWGRIGLDGEEVYAISYQELSALVHACPTEPYQGDDERVRDWVWTHGQVVDAAWAEAESVLPMTFDCIVHPAAGRSADETVAAWLQAEYDNFRHELAAFAGKVELGVQVLWQVEAISQALIDSNPEVRQLQQDLQSKPKGMAFFYQQKIQQAVKRGLEVKADEDYRRYYRCITTDAAAVHVNKTKRPAEGKQMLMNLSVLMGKEQVTELGQRLDQINGETGVEIRFTGPWPPYSFVAKARAPEAEKN